MKINPYPPTNRLVFFDNLRTLMILLVLIFHSGASYTSMVAFWPFHEPTNSDLVEILVIISDVFTMTVLFFIAGYFALPSLQRQGDKRFLTAKLRRLGIPWLVVIFSALPVLDYIHYRTQSMQAGISPHEYGTHWLLSVKKIAELYVGRLRMSDYFNMTEHFYQRYVWFLSLLFLFFLIFWLLHKVTREWRWFSVNAIQKQENLRSNAPVFLVLSWVGVLSILLFTAVKFLASSPADPMDMVWYSLGNIFQFQMAKLAFYIPSFGLGVYAYSKGWFTNEQDFGRPVVWGGIVFLLMVANMFLGRTMTRAVDPSLSLQLGFLVLYPLWTLSFLGFFMAYASRHWNSSSHLNQELALNSYNMYLVHYVFVLTLPLLLSAWFNGTVLVKFGIVSLTTIVLSYALSRWVLQRYSRFAVVGLIGLNILLAVTTRGS